MIIRFNNHITNPNKINLLNSKTIIIKSYKSYSSTQIHAQTIEFKYQDITKKIIGAAMKVHSTLGDGFQEVIYQRALALQMKADNISFIKECNIPIYYLEQHISERRVDFFVDDKICVELKAITNLEAVHFAQARNYLEAFNIEIGLLINFGAISLQFKRLSNPKYNPSIINHPQNPNYLPKS